MPAGIDFTRRQARPIGVGGIPHTGSALRPGRRAREIGAIPVQHDAARLSHDQVYLIGTGVDLHGSSQTIGQGVDDHAIVTQQRAIGVHVVDAGRERTAGTFGHIQDTVEQQIAGDDHPVVERPAQRVGGAIFEIPDRAVRKYEIAQRQQTGRTARAEDRAIGQYRRAGERAGAGDNRAVDRVQRGGGVGEAAADHQRAGIGDDGAAKTTCACEIERAGAGLIKSAAAVDGDGNGCRGIGRHVDGGAVDSKIAITRQHKIVRQEIHGAKAAGANHVNRAAAVNAAEIHHSGVAVDISEVELTITVGPVGAGPGPRAGAAFDHPVHRCAGSIPVERAAVSDSQIHLSSHGGVDRIGHVRWRRGENAAQIKAIVRKGARIVEQAVRAGANVPAGQRIDVQGAVKRKTTIDLKQVVARADHIDRTKVKQRRARRKEGKGTKGQGTGETRCRPGRNRTVGQNAARHRSSAAKNGAELEKCVTLQAAIDDQAAAHNVDGIWLGIDGVVQHQRTRTNLFRTAARQRTIQYDIIAIGIDAIGNAHPVDIVGNRHVCIKTQRAPGTSDRHRIRTKRRCAGHRQCPVCDADPARYRIGAAQHQRTGANLRQAARAGQFGVHCRGVARRNVDHAGSRSQRGTIGRRIDHIGIRFETEQFIGNAVGQRHFTANIGEESPCASSPRFGGSAADVGPIGARSIPHAEAAIDNAIAGRAVAVPVIIQQLHDQVDIPAAHGEAIVIADGQGPKQQPAGRRAAIVEQRVCADAKTRQRVDVEGAGKVQIARHHHQIAGSNGGQIKIACRPASKRQIGQRERADHRWPSQRVARRQS